MAERDEAESAVQKRGDGVRQRALGLAAELREEKALNAQLRAASEEGECIMPLRALQQIDHSICRKTAD